MKRIATWCADRKDSVGRKRRMVMRVSAFLLMSAAPFCLTVIRADMARAVQTESSVSDLSVIPYPVRILRQPLRDVFGDIAGYLDIALDLSPGVKGIVMAPPAGLTVGALLRWLENEFELYTFFDGMALHVAAKSESRSALIDLQGVSRDRLMDTLEELDLVDDRFVARDAADTGMLMVGGPPAYRLAVERVFHSLAARKSQPVVVYRGGSQP